MSIGIRHLMFSSHDVSSFLFAAGITPCDALLKDVPASNVV